MSLVERSDMTQTVQAMMADVFDDVAVMDEEVRRKLCSMLLTDADFTGSANDKYALSEFVSGGFVLNDLITEETQRVLTFETNLTSIQQAALIRNNRDVKLIFEPGRIQSHAYAYVQRVIDTDRCLRALNHNSGTIIDIGGNYNTHQKRGRAVHCCGLADNPRDMHRHVERFVTMASQNRRLHPGEACFNGVQNCNVKARQSMSVHVMPDIPWELWPEIMDRHNLQYHIGVFHYDPVMLTTTNGKLEDVDMFYDISDGKVVMHFEYDSSRSYSHDWANYKKYTTPWVQLSLTSQYAYAYDFKHVAGGVATVEIYRFYKSDLAMQVPKQLYAYVPMEDKVQLETWVYDVESMLAPSLPSAYMPVSMTLSAQLYKYMYLYGVSNDTENPNKPVTFSQFRDMGRTYNYVRKFGQVDISAKRRISSLELEHVLLGIYAVVVHEKAVAVARSQAMTEAMLRKQQYHGMSAVTITLDAAVRLTCMPLLAAGNAFTTMVHQLKLKWKEYLASDLKLSSVKYKQSYIPVKQHTHITYAQGAGGWSAYPRSGSVSAYSGDDMKDYFQDFADYVDVEAERELVSEPILSLPYKPNIEGSTAVSGDATTEEQRVELETLQESYNDADGEAGHGLLSQDEYIQDYKVAYESEVDDYNRMVSNHTGEIETMRVVADELLHACARYQILEFAMYCFDVGNGIIKEAMDITRRVCPGTKPLRHVLDNYNNGQETGLVVATVNSGVVQPVAKSYSMAIDLSSKRPLVLHRSSNSVTVPYDYVSAVMLLDSLKIFNWFALAKQALDAYRSGSLPTARMVLVDGVPGCGKTAEIVENFTLNDLIISTVRHSKDDTFLRLMKLDQFKSHAKELKVRVRTLDSMTMFGFRGKSVSVDIMYVDEGLMAFPGQLMVAILKAKPRLVKVFGDSKQIRALDRSTGLGVLRYKSVTRWSAMENRNLSRTMPADICVYLKRLGYGDIKTQNPVRRSVELVLEPSVSVPVYTESVEGWNYLSVLRGDRVKLLQQRGFSDGKLAMRELEAKLRTQQAVLPTRLVFTVHEAQGQRFDRTLVVRLNPNTAAVLDSKPHMVVAISRHSYKLKYATVAVNDSLYKLLSRPVTDAEIDEVLDSPSQYMVDHIARLRVGELSR